MRILLATKGEIPPVVQSWLEAAAKREPIECRALTVIDSRPEEPGLVVEAPPQLVIERVTRKGDVVDTILAEAAEFQPALVGLMSRGLRGLIATTVRSTSSQLVERSTVPLLLFGPNCEPTEQLTQLLIPLDGSAYAGRAIGAIAGVARELRLSVFLLQVQGEYVPAPDTGERGGGIDVLESAYVMTVARELPGIEVTWDVAHGEAADRIVDYAGTLEGCVIVMTTHGHSGIRRKILGSVAEQVVARATRPVVVVPPRWSPQ